LERKEEKISEKHGMTSLKIVCQRRCNLLFSMLMFMPVVPAILARNERYCSRFRNNRLYLWLVDRSYDCVIKTMCCL